MQRADDIGDETDVAKQTLQVLNSSIQASRCNLTSTKAVSSQNASPSNNRLSILCLGGQVELELDGQNYCLNPGDNLAFNSDAFHRWRNTGTATGIAIFILPSA